MIAPHVQDYAVRLALATHPGGRFSDEWTSRHVRVGASPRGAQALVSAAKVKALIDGRHAVAFRDIESIAPAALRHRIVRSFEAEADAVSPDDIVNRLLRRVPREQL